MRAVVVVAPAPLALPAAADQHSIPAEQPPDSLFNGAVMTLVTVPTLIYGAEKFRYPSFPMAKTLLRFEPLRIHLSPSFTLNALGWFGRPE